MNLYEILELKPNASQVEIKKAYHRLVKIYHPDKNNSPDANERFQKIHSAYEILINDKSRYEYQKMNETEQFSFVEVLEKIISDTFGIDELKRYGINIGEIDFDYLQKNFMNFFKAINVSELLNLFTKGVVPKKNFNNIINCSESEFDMYDETCAEYYFNLPISIQKINSLDIKLDLNIKLGDLTNKNKRKIKIKRKVNDMIETSTFMFNIINPYVVFHGAGDSLDGDFGNLIIKLNLPTNLWWTENLILIEQPMILYEMIYGLDICIDMGDSMNININNWVPSRDGFFIEVTNENNKDKIKLSQMLANNINLGIKLYLNYEDTPEKQQILKEYFS